MSYLCKFASLIVEDISSWSWVVVDRFDISSHQPAATSSSHAVIEGRQALINALASAQAGFQADTVQQVVDRCRGRWVKLPRNVALRDIGRRLAQQSISDRALEDFPCRLTVMIGVTEEETAEGVGASTSVVQTQ